MARWERNDWTWLIAENDLCLNGGAPPKGINIHSLVFILGGDHNLAFW